MFEGFVGIGLVVLELDLFSIPSDEPETQFIVTAGKIVLGELEPIVDPVKPASPAGTTPKGCGLPVLYKEWESIPSLFNLDDHVDLVTAK